MEWVSPSSEMGEYQHRAYNMMGPIFKDFMGELRMQTPFMIPQILEGKAQFRVPPVSLNIEVSMSELGGAIQSLTTFADNFLSSMEVLTQKKTFQEDLIKLGDLYGGPEKIEKYCENVFDLAVQYLTTQIINKLVNQCELEEFITGLANELQTS